MEVVKKSNQQLHLTEAKTKLHYCTLKEEILHLEVRNTAL